MLQQSALQRDNTVNAEVAERRGLLIEEIKMEEEEKKSPGDGSSQSLNGA